MKKAKEYGHLATAVAAMPGMAKQVKPTLRINARMDDYGSPMEDNSYQKEQAKRLRIQIKAIEDRLANWDHEEAGAQAQKSLKQDLAGKKARLLECEAALGEDAEGEVGAKGKGAAVGGPYEIKPEGGKFLVMNMETGKVKGTHATKEKAMRQFRLLEMIEHGEEPRAAK